MRDWWEWRPFVSLLSNYLRKYQQPVVLKIMDALNDCGLRLIDRCPGIGIGNGIKPLRLIAVAVWII
jgi:hypothetical protein